MSDTHETRADAEREEGVAETSSAASSAEELSEDALEDVAGGAMCQVGLTGFGTPPTFPTPEVDYTF